MNRIVFSLSLLFLSVSVFAQDLKDYTLRTEAEYEVHPADYGMDHEEIFIKTTDDLKLRAWLFPAPEKSREMIIMCSDGQGNMADDLEIAGKFISLNYHVIMFDYRGFGESSDFRVSSKFYIYNQFHQDVDAVLDYAKKQHATNNVSLYGRGIGANLAIGSGATNLRVKRVIADGPVPSMEHVKKKVMELTEEKILMPLSYNNKKLEPKFALVENGEHLRGVLIISGRDDKLASVNAMNEIINGNKKLISVYVVEGSDQANKNFETSNDEFAKTVKAFLEGETMDNRNKDEKK